MLIKKIFHRERKVTIRSKANSRRATSAVEFALIAPIMILFTFGLIEISRVMLVKQSATHATREGARVAVRPQSESSEVTARVQEELALLGVNAATIEVDPAPEVADPGSQITVRVAIDAASVSWVSGIFNFSESTIQAESSMRRESTN